MQTQTKTMTRVFFYGLFMDKDLLQEKGFKPSDAVMASLQHYGLRLAERATLVPSKGERVYGMLMSLDDNELERLYGDESVKDYLPETVRVKTLNGREQEARVYNLPPAYALVDKNNNPQYATALKQVSQKLGLPKDYIAEIEKWCES